MNSIIEVKNLGKKYNIGERQGYVALRDVLANIVKAPAKWFGGKIKTAVGLEKPNEFWALKDVNFTVEKGEVLGIIGRNGAGKSTLLKILSQITPPTTGEIKLKGRVGSLLEVGTGFHPELTGRENIYLNGAILGMRKKEIEKKFDEIVEFAGIEKFLDMPVKRYSSGMYVRLAFAVAAHLEPEILIVDEVLAVGDAEFQKKCLGKMEDVTKKDGRTVLFVSHNMGAIQRLCNRTIVLDDGQVKIDTNSSDAINFYLHNFGQSAALDIKKTISDLPKDSVFELADVIISQAGHQIGSVVENGLPLDIQVNYQVLKETSGLRIFFDLYDEENNLLFRSFHDEDNDNIPNTKVGSYVSQVAIPADWLSPARYRLEFWVTIFNVRYIYQRPIVIDLDVSRTGLSNRAYMMEPIRGKLAPLLKWDTKNV